MARLHNSMDIYVGNDLAWANATVIERFAEHQLVIKAKIEGRLQQVADFTDTDLLSSTNEMWAWDATLDGNRVRVSMVRRTAGCVPCTGGRR